MILVRVESPTSRVELRGQSGDRVLDLLDAVGSPLELSCRAANCATCLVEVEGEGALAEATAAERSVLEAQGAGPRTRLACQVILAGDGGVVVLRAGRGLAGR